MPKQTEKYTSASASKYGKDGWRGSLMCKEGSVWKRKMVKLETKGRTEKAKKAAEMEVEAIRVAENEKAGDVSTTVRQYVSEYIDGRVNYVEKSTASEYRRLLERHIAPTLGDIPLDELTPSDVQRWVNEQAKAFSAGTVRKALVLLRSAMTEAVERDELAKNPTRTVKGPKNPARKPNALDESGRAKVAGFIALEPGSPLSIGFALALYLGLREGEICGLRWRYVDLDAGTITIQETIGYDKSPDGKGSLYVKEPKTGGSRRILPIPEVLQGALRTRRAHMNGARLACGKELADMYVVGKDDGSFMQPHYLSTRWRKTADVLELVGTEGTRPTFHDLRHTFATAAITHGVDVKTVSSVMGHANAAMTLNIYASADADAKRRGVSAVSDAIAAESERQRTGAQVIEFGKTGTEA